METKSKQRFSVILLCAGIIAGVSVAFTPIVGFLVAIMLWATIPNIKGKNEIF